MSTSLSFWAPFYQAPTQHGWKGCSEEEQVCAFPIELICMLTARYMAALSKGRRYFVWGSAVMGQHDAVRSGCCQHVLCSWISGCSATVGSVGHHKLLLGNSTNIFGALTYFQRDVGRQKSRSHGKPKVGWLTEFQILSETEFKMNFQNPGVPSQAIATFEMSILDLYYLNNYNGFSSIIWLCM